MSFYFGYFHGEKAVEGEGIQEFLRIQRDRIFSGQENNTPYGNGNVFTSASMGIFSCHIMLFVVHAEQSEKSACKLTRPAISLYWCVTTTMGCKFDHKLMHANGNPRITLIFNVLDYKTA